MAAQLKKIIRDANSFQMEQLLPELAQFTFQLVARSGIACRFCRASLDAAFDGVVDFEDTV